MYIIAANPICFKLLKQLALRAFSLARAKTGNRIAANIAILAMTTKSSINVNALDLLNCRFIVYSSLNLNSKIP